MVANNHKGQQNITNHKHFKTKTSTEKRTYSVTRIPEPLPLEDKTTLLEDIKLERFCFCIMDHVIVAHEATKNKATDSLVTMTKNILHNCAHV